ncbi:MAG: DNA polymerase III subunit delta [Bacteroidales bacterium]|nr:DNA polymerase III subunit delta [Bacteroidales bacterium]MDD4673828.1 DNA polymerase III subunit delta [Bacteroidales bacterium]MDY0347741.1 DNA polymerase III subunit delta [Tenuifilaceae bacterium]
MAKRKTIVETSADIISDLKKKIYKPVYILSGDEHYYIDLISDFIAQNVLTESEKAFNLTTLYGKDLEVKTIVETSRRFPMMANHQVVIVKEAQQIKSIEDLEVYIKAPQKSTILVICHKLAPGVKLKAKVRQLYTAAGKIGVFIDSKRLYDNKVPGWITGYLYNKGFSIAPKSTELLTEFLGNDLSKVVNELDKLIVTMPSGVTQITTDHIEKNIGISKDFNRFELNTALGQRDIMRVNRIVDHFAKNPAANPFVVTVSSIHQYFIKIFKHYFIQDKSERNLAVQLGVNPFFVSEYTRAARIYKPSKCVQIFELLREYDLKSKGLDNSSVTHGDLLKELVFKIMH